MTFFKKTLILSSLMTVAFVSFACGNGGADDGSEDTLTTSEFDTPVTPARR